MKIASLTIKNYRAIDFLKIKLSSNIQFIYGINGTGKSSIIYAIHCLLATINSILMGTKKEDLLPIFNTDFIRDSSKNSYIYIKFDSGEIAYALRSYKKININSKHISCTYLPDGTIVNYGTIKNQIKFRSFIPGASVSQIKNEVTFDGKTIGFEQSPLFARARGLIGYDYFKKEITSLIINEYKSRIESIKDGKEEIFNPILTTFRECIQEINPTFKDVGCMSFNGQNFLTIKKDGKDLNVDTQLSSGESSIISILGILSVLYYQSDFICYKNTIICIDEFDISLHPSWQIKLCKILIKKFPDVQFIASSHSPFIWYALNRNNILWLKYNHKNKLYIEKNIKFAKGAFIDNIVSTFFDIDDYDQDIALEINKIEEDIERRNIKIALDKIKSLREQYGDIQILKNLEFKIRISNDKY